MGILGLGICSCCRGEGCPLCCGWVSEIEGSTACCVSIRILGAEGSPECCACGRVNGVKPICLRFGCLWTNTLCTTNPACGAMTGVGVWVVHEDGQVTVRANIEGAIYGSPPVDASLCTNLEDLGSFVLHLEDYTGVEERGSCDVSKLFVEVTFRPREDTEPGELCTFRKEPCFICECEDQPTHIEFTIPEGTFEPWQPGNIFLADPPANVELCDVCPGGTYAFDMTGGELQCVENEFLCQSNKKVLREVVPFGQPIEGVFEVEVRDDCCGVWNFGITRDNVQNVCIFSLSRNVGTVDPGDYPSPWSWGLVIQQSLDSPLRSGCESCIGTYILTDQNAGRQALPVSHSLSWCCKCIGENTTGTHAACLGGDQPTQRGPGIPEGYPLGCNIHNGTNHEIILKIS